MKYNANRKRKKNARNEELIYETGIYQARRSGL